MVTIFILATVINFQTFGCFVAISFEAPNNHMVLMEF